MTENKGDLISRKALKKAVNTFFDEHFKGLVPTELIEYAKAVDEIIDNAPTVKNEYMRGYEAAEREYKRPQGEWIEYKNSDGYLKCYECSECKKCQGYISNFCEDCGADMRGGAE